MARSFPTYYRGWREVTPDEFEDVRDLNEWLGPKHPGLRQYWCKRMFQYLQQRMDAVELFW